MKKLLLSLSALLLLAALVFTGIYFTRFQSMAALQKITDYSDGYNLYRMDIRYRYSLNDLLARGITDDQSMVDAILEEALPGTLLRLHRLCRSGAGWYRLHGP